MLIAAHCGHEEHEEGQAAALPPCWWVAGAGAVWQVVIDAHLYRVTFCHGDLSKVRHMCDSTRYNRAAESAARSPRELPADPLTEGQPHDQLLRQRAPHAYPSPQRITL